MEERDKRSEPKVCPARDNVNQVISVFFAAKRLTRTSFANLEGIFRPLVRPGHHRNRSARSLLRSAPAGCRSASATSHRERTARCSW